MLEEATGGDVVAAGEVDFSGGMTRGARNVGFTGAALALGALPGWAFSRPAEGEEPDALTLLHESLAWPHLKQRLFVGQHPEAVQTLHTQAPGIADPPHNLPCMTTGIGPLKSMFLTLSAEIISLETSRRERNVEQLRIPRCSVPNHPQ